MDYLGKGLARKAFTAEPNNQKRPIDERVLPAAHAIDMNSQHPHVDNGRVGAGLALRGTLLMPVPGWDARDAYRGRFQE